MAKNGSVPPSFPSGIYGILGEKFSLGRSNEETARRMVEGGIDVIQYREKAHLKDRRDMLAECEKIRRITADAGVLFIVNDFLDIALISGADGVHVGQEDLPVTQVKALAPHLMVGCSTHSPDQAEKAIKDGADYIGVGPVFDTQTKEDIKQIVGLEYVAHVAQNYEIPFTAIGGLKRHNLKEVMAAGATSFCMVTEIIRAKDIEQRLQEIRAIIGEPS